MYSYLSSVQHIAGIPDFKSIRYRKKSQASFGVFDYFMKKLYTDVQGNPLADLTVSNGSTFRLRKE